MSLKKVFEPYFKIGTAVSDHDLHHPEALEELKKHYSTITCENSMKPEMILDRKANCNEPARYDREPALCFESVKPYLEFARENGIGMRGHTLVWHQQTPRWFFARNYSTAEDAELADRESMLARLESYIRQVLQFVQSEYPGVIYTWDVVNEAIEEGGLRDSLWTQTIGEDFVREAFFFAARYKAEGVSLFYNDYDTFLPWKRELIIRKILKPLLEEKLVDGIGMQSHMTMDQPSMEEYQNTVETYGSLGIEVGITELDLHQPDATKKGEEELALRYRQLFTILTEAVRNRKAKITSVTFWGMQDEESWLTGFRKERSYPLLFSRGYRTKAAYDAVITVPGRVEQDLGDRLPGGERFAFWETKECILREFHVNASHPNASDEGEGSAEAPFLTIQAAASRVEPGTKVWIHGGVYRECVRPAKGGTDPEHMVTFEAFGEEVVIKASVVAEEFEASTGYRLTAPGVRTKAESEAEPAIWAVRLKPEQFQGYNPFCAVNILHDRLFIEYDKTDMTTYLNRRGMVFCDGKPLTQVALYYQLGQTPGSYWVEANGQTVHFRLEADDDPGDHLIELTSREQCFAPEIPFLSYIKVKGLTCAHSATGAPVPQRGAISCYRGHHWIIENCKIDWSNGVGIDIGNECWHHTYDPKQLIGYTVIRGCEIRDAGVCGIAGMFAVGLLIEDNLIEGTGWQKMELSWEAGGIKVHNTMNSLIRRNIFRKTFRADHLWMDVGNENNRITKNLFLDGIQQREAIFIECTREGINLIDNNLFWNVEGRFREEDIPAEPGSTGWYKMEEHSAVNGYAVYGEGTDRLHIVHNLIGNCRSAGYFAKPVSFRVHGNSRGGTSRDAKISHNLFYDCKEAAIKFPTKDNEAEGNLYVQMPGGYLRILYPAPEVCLDLKSWQEFYGFDREGQEGCFTVSVDTGQLTLVMEESRSLSERAHYGTGTYLERIRPEEVTEIRETVWVSEDFYGNTLGEMRVPGPFGHLESGRCYDLDPRIKN